MNENKADLHKRQLQENLKSKSTEMIAYLIKLLEKQEQIKIEYTITPKDIP